MLLLLLLTLSYSVLSFDLEKTKNYLEDGNLVKGLLDGSMKINKNGEEIEEKLEKLEKNLELINGLSEKNPLADFDLGRIAEVSRRTKRDTEPKSAPNPRYEYRFCRKEDFICDCGDADSDSDLPESLDWSQNITMPSPARSRNSSDDADVFAGVIADYAALLNQIKHDKVVKLAAQQLTDCAEDWDHFLSWMGPVTRLVIQGGFELESDYPSNSSDSKCRFDRDKISVAVIFCIQLNIEKENCLKCVLNEFGPALVGLRKANWDYSLPIMHDCDAVLDTYTPYILIGYGKEDVTDVWYLLNPEGKKFSIPRGVACQDIGMYTTTFAV